ncbi:MAG: TatD family hydrolase [Deltaproteobacteria bacterium]|nr:TatD family hydrolase [Deltaproteobacteria bacterium]
MTWIDIGVNLTDKSFAGDRDQVMARARDRGVEAMVLTGTSVSGSRAAAELAAEHPDFLFSTAGVHPHDAKSCDQTTMAELRSLASLPQVVAIGECGLDFNRNLSPPDVQRAQFEAQLELAAELSLPVFVHERDAGEAMLELLGRHRSQLGAVVVHCFTGNEKTLRGYLELDLYIGITGWICDERRGLHLRELIPLIPSNRLMLETDAPYLLPRTIRPRPKSRRNEPAYITHVADTVAAALGIPVAELAKRTTGTAREFFGIPVQAGKSS